MKRVVFFVLFFFVLANARSQNLVVNPGLETWETSTKPSGWVMAQNCMIEPTSIYSGIYSCKQTATTESRDLNQTIAVLPDKYYTFTVYYLTDPATTGNGGRIWCKWLNGSTDVTDEVSKELMQTAYLKSSTWKLYSFTVKAPPAANKILLQVRTLPNSITYWDNFIFEETLPTGLGDDVKTLPEIYPVPADDYLIIRNAYGIKSIEVLDISGSKLRSVTSAGDGEIRLYVGDLRRGIYVLRIHNGVKVVFRKFLKS